MGQSAGCCHKEDVGPSTETIQAEPQQDDAENPMSEIVGVVGGTVLPIASVCSSEPINVVALSSMDVNLEIMRGISLRKCLRNVRNLWWASPLDLPEKIRSNLWKKSASVSGFDVFLSHTWQSSGLRKCLALLLQSTWMWGLAFWLFILLLLMIIYMQNLLPTPSGYSLPQRYGGGTVPQGPWMAIFSLPSCLFGLALAVYLPERIWQSPTCFLDAVSIHQTDQGLMKQGVYGLGGFLKASKELRILWSAPYFSRLWCIFELAAYRTANPTGKITLAPVFVESAVAAYFVASYLACVSFTLDRQSFLFLSLVGQMVSTYILIWYLRRNLSVKRKLISDLQNFDIAQAQCRLQYDRDFVLDAITDWFGSQEAFTDYVRGNLGKAATSGFSGSMIPIQYQLLIVTPEVSLNMDTFVALWQSNLPAEFLYSHFLGMVLGYAICWRIVTVSLVVFLCDWAPSLRSWKAVGLDIFILLATNVCTVTGLYTSQYAYRHGVVAASVWLLTACLLACLFQLRPGKFCTREATE